MEVLTEKFKVDGRGGSWELDVYGDTHLGTVCVDEERLKADISDTKDKGRYWCHVGDIVDGIIPGDRRFSQLYQQTLAPWAKQAFMDGNLIEAQWDRFVELFSPIADKGLFALSGDGKHNRTENIADCFKNARKKLNNIPGGFPACFYIPRFDRNKDKGSIKTIPMVFHHGYFAGRTKGNKINHLERALNQYHEAWIFCCGHGHDKIPVRIDSLAVEGDKVCGHVRRGAMTGSYLRTYTQGSVGYGEIAGYPLSALGKISLIVHPFQGKPEERITFKNI